MKRLVTGLVLTIVVLAQPLGTTAGATTSDAAKTKTFQVPLPDAGGQTFGVVTITGKAKAGKKPSVTATVGNVASLPLDVRPAGAITKATKHKGKTTIKVLVAINSLATAGVSGFSGSSERAAQQADALELIIGAAGFVAPSEHLIIIPEPEFCNATQNLIKKVRAFVSIGNFTSTPEAIFQNVRLDHGCK